MVAGVSLVVISGTILFVCNYLFSLEEKRGKRLIFAQTRSTLDTVVVRFWQFVASLGTRLGVGTFRMIMHFIIHQFLGWCLRLVQMGETYIHYLQKRNRSVVKGIQSEKKNSHLDSIAAHKEAVTLSEEEKQALKNRHLEG